MVLPPLGPAAPPSPVEGDSTSSPDADQSKTELRADGVARQLSEARTPRQLYIARSRASELADEFPSCASCRRVYARALERSGMWDEAARQWRKVIKLLGRDSEALLSLADYHVAEGLRYRTMISGPISLSEFGYEDLEHAVDYLVRLRETPGGHGLAAMRLAELALALSTWTDAVRYATSAALYSNEPKAHAIMGAALLRAGDTEEAAREFERFFTSAPDSIKALYNDPEFFFARPRLDLRRTDRPVAASASQWDERDPRLLTPENERLLEHYARVTIAAVRCRSRPGTWDGARTEQGVLLIRLGEPLSETRIRPEISDDGLLRYEELRYHYPEYTIVLDDQSLMGRFHLAGGGTSDSLSFVEGVRLIKRIKERFDPHGGEPALAMVSQTWLLPRGERDLAVTALDIPASDVELQWDGMTMPFARFAVATRWRPAPGGETPVSTERFASDRIRGCRDSAGFTAAFMETLSAGVWDFSLEIEDRTTGKWVRRDTTILVDSAPPGPGLTIGGPIPCWTNGEQRRTGVLLEETSLLPTARPVYGARDTLVMYTEIHGMTPARWDLHQGSITYSVGRMDRRPWWRRVLSGRTAPEVSVEIEAQGPGEHILSQVELQLPHIAPGPYEFLLRCADDVVGRFASGRSMFDVCGEPEE